MLIPAGEIISKSIDLYKKNWQLFLKYIGLLLIPSALIIIAASLLGVSQKIMFAFLSNQSWGSVIVYILIVIILSITSIWISMGLIKSIANRYEGKETDMITDIKSSTPLILTAIGASILSALAILGGMILLIIPGVIFSVWFVFTLYAVVLDNKGAAESLSFSKRLVQGRWWDILWRLLAPGIVFALLGVALQWIVGIPLGIILKSFGGSIIGITIYSVISNAVAMLITPLSGCAITILYLEAKKTPVVMHTPEVDQKPIEKPTEEPKVK